ncbi:MAG: biotin transporter BioY [Micropruina sp.]|nr:MAG: biotin transporter BioY [Micropruina sp.]
MSPAARPSSPSGDLALIAVFAALIAAFSIVPAIPLGPVPITLQTLAVVLTGLVLGPWRAFAATALYLAVGLLGLPVFAGGAGGLGVLGKPTIGYLLSFPIAALVAGGLVRAWVPAVRGLALLWFFLAATAASVVIHTAGIAGLMTILHVDLGKALAIDLPFVPVDLAKNVVAAGLAAAVHKAFPALLTWRRPATA